MEKPILSLLAFLVFLFSCQNHSDQPDLKSLRFQEIPNPVKEGGEPNLFVGSDGRVFLS